MSIPDIAEKSNIFGRAPGAALPCDSLSASVFGLLSSTEPVFLSSRSSVTGEPIKSINLSSKKISKTKSIHFNF